MLSKALLVQVLATLSYALPASEPQGELVAPASLGGGGGGGSVVRPDWATIENVTFAGTGCPAGTVTSQISGDKSIINLSFAEYYAQKFDGAKPADVTKNCNVNLKVRFPPGFSLTVATTDVRGFAILDKSCQATVGGRFWWSGNQQDASIQSPIKGPFLGEYTKTVSVPTAALVWSNCGPDGPLFNIDTRLLAQCTKKTDEAFVQIDAQDTALKTPLQWSLGLEWRRC